MTKYTNIKNVYNGIILKRGVIIMSVYRLV